MIRDVNLLNNGNANLLVPKSEVLSADATLSNLISLASTFSLISNSAKSRCCISLVMCGISEAYTHASDDCGILGKSHKIYLAMLKLLLSSTGSPP